MAKARNPVYAAVKPIRELLESLGSPIDFRKLDGILNALEMQVEDGHFQKHAVTRLCEAMLATVELYEVDEEAASRLERLACGLIDLVKRRGGRVRRGRPRRVSRPADGGVIAGQNAR